jgi:hypothetical protein
MAKGYADKHTPAPKRMQHSKWNAKYQNLRLCNIVILTLKMKCTVEGELILNINRVSETKWGKRHEFSFKMLNLERQPMPT